MILRPGLHSEISLSLILSLSLMHIHRYTHRDTHRHALFKCQIFLNFNAIQSVLLCSQCSVYKIQAPAATTDPEWSRALLKEYGNRKRKVKRKKRHSLIHWKTLKSSWRITGTGLIQLFQIPEEEVSLMQRQSHNTVTVWLKRNYRPPSQVNVGLEIPKS